MTRAKKIMFGLLTVVSLLSLVTLGWAQDTQWNVTGGEWTEPGNWTNGVPTSTMEAWMNYNPCWPSLDGTSGSAGRLVVGYGNDIYASLTLDNNASLTITNDMLLGVQSPSSGGTCNINSVGSALSVGGNLIVGDGGLGNFYNRGALQVAGGLYVAKTSSSSSGSFGSYGGDSSFGSAYIGVNGQGSFQQWSGTVSITNGLTCGVNSGSYGSYGFEGDVGLKNLEVGSMLLGQNPGSMGYFSVHSGATATITNSLVAGDGGRGGVSHSDGQVTAGSVILGKKGGSKAEYDLKGTGSLTTGNLMVGQGDPGTNPVDWGATFYQGRDDGIGQSTVTVTGALTIGAAKPVGWTSDSYRYYLGKGTLNVHDLVASAGTFDIKDAAALINVSGDFSVGPDGRFFAVAGAAINMTGVNFFNHSNSMVDLWGLGNLSLIFSGGGTSWKTMEIGGKDYGEDIQGFDYNFHMTDLTVTGNNTRVSLKDAVNNGNRGPGNAPEALYVNTLNLNSGATLNLNNLPLYTYYNSQIHRVKAGEGSLFGDGSGQIINRSGNISGIIPLLLN